MIEDIIKDAERRMEKSIEALKHALAKLRTGRAHPSLLEQVMVPYYGNDTPLSQVANISVLDARTLQISPWEKSMVATVEKAIMQSNLGLNPSSVGELIRVPLPALTEERRREMTRLVRAEAENARISIRNVRRDSNAAFKELEKEKEITEDDVRRSEDRIQKLTDRFVKQCEELVEVKEKDLMAI